MIEQENKQEGYQKLATKQQLMTTQQQGTLSTPTTQKATVKVLGLLRGQPSQHYADHKTYQISLSLKDFYSMNTETAFWSKAKKNQPDQGYQRGVEEQRARDFARYTLNGHQSFSNYIFSIRKDMQEERMVEIEEITDPDGAIRSAWITIKKDCLVWIVDGSHRSFGLTDSQEHFEANSQLMEEYHMPVSLTIGQTKREEVEQFCVENKLAHPMSTDLADRCLYEMTQGPGSETADELKSRSTSRGLFKEINFVKSAYDIVDIMNSQHPDPNVGPSVFKNRLRAPNEKRKDNKAATISENGFAKSIKPIFGTRNSPLYKATAAETSKVLIDWWNAWAIKCPQPFQKYEPTGFQPNDYVIQQNIGTQSLNKLLSKIQGEFQLQSLTKLTQKNFEDIIGVDALIEPTNWLVSSGYWSKFGTNQKSFDDISEEMLYRIANDPIASQVIIDLGGRIPPTTLQPGQAMKKSDPSLL